MKMWKPALIVALCGLFAGLAAAEGEYTLTIADKEPPAELAAEVREALAPKAYQVSGPDGAVYEFWFVPSLTAKAIADKPRETLLNVEEISLFGAATVSDAEPHDFRDDPIDPGLFVLRMALQPKDGNHLGTAPYDTFAILIPNDRDGQLKDMRDHDTMVELAQEGTIAEHPPILSLQPFEKVDGEIPRIELNEEHEWEFLYLTFPIEADGTKSEITVGLVVHGVGEL